MSFVPSPSKKIMILMASAVIIIGAIGANKFWPSKTAEPLVMPAYNTEMATSTPQNSINGTEFLQTFVASTTATTTDDTPDTMSKNISHELFTNIAYLENTGSLNEQSKQALIDNTLSQIQNAFSYKQYGAEKLSYIASENAATVKTYAEDFATLQVRMILNMQKNVGAIEGNVGVLSKLYAKEAADLYALKIPKSIAQEHLEVVNAFSRAATALDTIVHEKEDPMKVPLAIRVYQDAQVSQSIALVKIADFIKSNGIIFATGNIGKYWDAFQ